MFIKQQLVFNYQLSIVNTSRLTMLTCNAYVCVAIIHVHVAVYVHVHVCKHMCMLYTYCGLEKIC